MRAAEGGLERDEALCCYLYTACRLLALGIAIQSITVRYDVPHRLQG